MWIGITILIFILLLTVLLFILKIRKLDLIFKLLEIATKSKDTYDFLHKLQVSYFAGEFKQSLKSIQKEVLKISNKETNDLNNLIVKDVLKEWVK